MPDHGARTSQLGHRLVSRIVSSGQVRQREPRVRDRAYLAWVSKLPCIACACRGRRKLGVHVAHIRMGFPAEPGWREFGKAEKPHDHHTAPLCPSCHLDGPQAQHRGNERAFWLALRIYPPAFCSALVAAYEAVESGDKVVSAAAQGAFCYCPAADASN